AFLEAARALDVSVVVGSDHANVFAAVHPEGLLSLDFREPRVAAPVAAEYHARHPLAAVLACDDDGVRIAAAIAAALGLAGSPPAAVERALDKRLMRQALAAAGVPSPWFEVWPVEGDAARFASHLHYPCVLKPPSLSASRGVLRANNAAEFEVAF